MTDSLSAMMRTFIRQGRTPVEATDMALERSSEGDLRDLVRPLLLVQARRLARDVVRRIEDTIPAVGHTSVSTSPDALRALLRQTFVLPSGERVAWGDATAQQHRERAEMYRSLADDHLARASRHEQAADVLERNGCENLAALYARGLEVKEIVA